MEFKEYLEFDLMLERTEAGYRARVLAAPAGTAVGEFGFPFSELELENFVLRMGQKRQSMRGTDSSEMLAAKDFGTRLYDTVFVGTVRSALDGSLSEAAEQAVGLRIRLRFASSAPELIDLPWEYLYNPDKNRFLSLSVDSPLVRDLDLTGRIEPLQLEPPLRVLVMIASPTDFDVLDVEKEWVRLKEAVADLEAAGRIVLDRTDTASLSALQRQLRKEDYHVFHFIGHGGFDEQARDGVLIFVDENGRGRRISGQQLGTILHDEKTLRLAILNACEGGRASFTDPFAGVAQSLLQQDIPAVIAMQFEVSDRAAITLAHEFYAAIADGYPVDAALSEARKSIYADVSDVEWGTPVLYMRIADGRVFDIIHSASVPVPGVAPPPTTPPPTTPPATTPPQITPVTPPPETPPAVSASVSPSAPTPTATPVVSLDTRRLLLIAGIAVATVVVVIVAYFVLRNLFEPKNPIPVANPPTPSVSTPTTPVTVGGVADAATPTSPATPATPTSPASPTSSPLSIFSQQLQSASASYNKIEVAGCVLPSRLWVGAVAYSSATKPGSKVYPSAAAAAAESVEPLGEIAPGNGMRVIDGPMCVQGTLFWQVTSQTSLDKGKNPLTGWTGEGDKSTKAYWLTPLVHPLANQPGSYFDCPGVYPSRIQKGDKVVVTFEPALANYVRPIASKQSTPDFRIRPGESVDVIGGPVCADGWVWWQVKNESGKTGWTSEGDADIYWLLPVNDLASSALRPGNQGVFIALPRHSLTFDAAFDDWTDKWQPLTIWSYPTPAAFGNQDNLSALAQVGWQTDGLLVAIQVTDDEYHFDTVTKLTDLWQWDSIEILFDRTLAIDQSMRVWNADDYQIVVGFGPDGDSPVAYQYNQEAEPRLQVAVEGSARLTSNGYAAEILLPWSAFGLDGLAAAQAAQPFGFTLSINDRDTGSSQERMLSSSPARRKQNDPTMWGTLILADLSAPSAGNFTFRGGTCQAAVATPLSGGMDRICVTFDYSNIPADSTVVREWNFLGKERGERSRWVRYECVWDQPESGQLQVDLRDPDVGLRSGIWEMTLTVASQEILREEITIPGDAEGWDPVLSTLTKCE